MHVVKWYNAGCRGGVQLSPAVLYSVIISKGNNMAMGVVSDEDLLKELESLNGAHNEVNTKVGNDITIDQLNDIIIDNPKAEVREIERGRGNGNNGVPTSLQKIIGETAIEEGRVNAKALTEALGISDSSLSAYTHGATSTSTYNNPNKDLNSHLTKVKRRIGKNAVGIMTRAFNHITDDKLKGEDAKALASIAKDMSAIIKNMEPEGEKDGKTINNQFVLMAPPVLTEDRFDTIVLNE